MKQKLSVFSDRDGTVLDNPPLAEDIAYDSELRLLKLIAWAADDSLLPRGGQRGFPHWATWLERNKRFAADFGSFFTGHGAPAIASSIATRSGLLLACCNLSCRPLNLPIQRGILAPCPCWIGLRLQLINCPAFAIQDLWEPGAVRAAVGCRIPWRSRHRQAGCLRVKRHILSGRGRPGHDRCYHVA